MSIYANVNIYIYVCDIYIYIYTVYHVCVCVFLFTPVVVTLKVSSMLFHVNQAPESHLYNRSLSQTQPPGPVKEVKLMNPKSGLKSNLGDDDRKAGQLPPLR